jgi:hypothetical protein
VTKRGRHRAGRRATVGLAIGFAVGLGVAGCGSPAPRSAPPAASAAATTGAPASAASVRPSSPAPSVGQPSPGEPSGDAVAADPALLALVPEGPYSLTYDPDTTIQVAADPDLTGSATGLAIAVAIPQATGPSGATAGPPGTDIAVVSVIRLRDPSVDEAWFRDWRDTYDEAACATAGGVARRAQTDIGSQTVYIGSCAGGSFTYHARIDDGSAVISLTSIGPSNIGERIVGGFAG